MPRTRMPYSHERRRAAASRACHSCCCPWWRTAGWPGSGRSRQTRSSTIAADAVAARSAGCSSHGCSSRCGYSDARERGSSVSRAVVERMQRAANAWAAGRMAHSASGRYLIFLPDAASSCTCASTLACTTGCWTTKWCATRARGRTLLHSNRLLCVRAPSRRRLPAVNGQQQPNSPQARAVRYCDDWHAAQNNRARHQHRRCGGEGAAGQAAVARADARQCTR